MDISLELTNDSSVFDIIAYDNEKEPRTQVGKIENIIKTCENEKYLEINSLGVNENYRGNGIAKELMKFSITEAKKRGCSYAHLLVHTDSKAEAAIKLYEKFQFKRLERKIDGMYQYKLIF